MILDLRCPVCDKKTFPTPLYHHHQAELLTQSRLCSWIHAKCQNASKFKAEIKTFITQDNTPPRNIQLTSFRIKLTETTFPILMFGVNINWSSWPAWFCALYRRTSKNTCSQSRTSKLPLWLLVHFSDHSFLYRLLPHAMMVLGNWAYILLPRLTLLAPPSLFQEMVVQPSPGPMCSVLITVYAAVLVVTKEENNAQIRKPLEIARVTGFHRAAFLERSVAHFGALIHVYIILIRVKVALASSYFC